MSDGEEEHHEEENFEAEDQIDFLLFDPLKPS